MTFTIKHIILAITAILVLFASFYFYMQFFSASITQCPGWYKEIEKLLSQANYCNSSQECETFVVAHGCCGRREYVNAKFYQKGALRSLLAKYNKYCSSKDLCAGEACPVDAAQQVVCENNFCLTAK